MRSSLACNQPQIAEARTLLLALTQAFNWALANRAKYNICAINLSLGDSKKSTTPCRGSVYEAPFAAARAAGVVPVVAAGNNYFTDGISGPACAPSAVSVGAGEPRGFGVAPAAAGALSSAGWQQLLLHRWDLPPSAVSVGAREPRGFGFVPAAQLGAQPQFTGRPTVLLAPLLGSRNR